MIQHRLSLFKQHLHAAVGCHYVSRVHGCPFRIVFLRVEDNSATRSNHIGNVFLRHILINANFLQNGYQQSKHLELLSVQLVKQKSENEVPRLVLWNSNRGQERGVLYSCHQGLLQSTEKFLQKRKGILKAVLIEGSVPYFHELPFPRLSSLEKTDIWKLIQEDLVQLFQFLRPYGTKEPSDVRFLLVNLIQDVGQNFRRQEQSRGVVCR